MARAGFFFRFLKPCAVAALLAVVAACGGGGAPPGPEVVRITIAGMPGTPLAPMQTAQLTAAATYSDGAMKDVTATATWDSANPSVVTVSAAGLVTATGPGTADVSATFGGASGTAGAQVIALPAAYFSEGVEYAFEYQLDADGRVDNYRISQRPGIDYGASPSASPIWAECAGSLRGSYRCTGRWWQLMTGEAGRVVTISGLVPDPWSVRYTYATFGLSGIETQRQGPTNLESHSGVFSLTYDLAGRLTEVRSDCRYISRGPGFRTEKTARIEVDALGRLLHAEVSVVNSSSWGGESTTDLCGSQASDWTYDTAGYMKSASSTQYSADAEGWLVSRSTSQGGQVVVDSYSIFRSGAKVVEEQFTRAEPSAFYENYAHAPQRVRYEWGRLPSEPLFVPRALTGLNGADYFGIISSHHR